MKNIFLAIIAFSLSSSLFSQGKPTEDWYHQNTATSQGIDINRAYQELLPGKTSTTIIVAVIDGGVDPTHEDLKSVMWINEDEIADNGKDDDNNGYIDDIFGWNFIGGPTEDVGPDNLEITRVYMMLNDKFKGKTETDISKSDKKEYQKYVKVKKAYDTRLAKAKEDYAQVDQYKRFFDAAKTEITAKIGKSDYTLEEVKAIDVNGDERMGAFQELIIYDLENDFSKEIERMEEHFGAGVNYLYNTEFDTRKIIGDNYSDLSERNYGNNRVGALDPGHGTHVAGIIGADRTNNLGVKGVADNVKIMALRVVPGGDERDKDIANAIYYAVDNGAKIINMSFGKSYSPFKTAIDIAMQYAVDHNVLLVHAAGNSHKLNTTTNNYPNQFIGEKKCKRLDTWIEVGAEGWATPADLATDFSNYGKKTVDIFAPGQDIYSTVPGDDYEFFNGTSMAAPVVAGVAALVWSYYPSLTAKQVKKIILKSGTDYKNTMVNVPGKDEQEKFKNLSRTGKVVNVYEALKLAEKMAK